MPPGGAFSMAWRSLVTGMLVVVAGACSNATPPGNDLTLGGGTADDDGGPGDATVGDDDDDGDGTGDGTDGPTGPGSDDVSDTTGVDDDTSTGAPDEDTGPPGDAELLFLSISPPDTIFELDLGMGASQPFIVSGHYDDGTTANLTAMVDSWSVTNPQVGMMNASTLQIPGFAASFFGSTIVTATIGAEEGQAQVTVAAYNKSGADQDFFFVLPYLDPAGDQDKPLTFSTDVKALDVFFNMDTTISMSGPIANLQSSLADTVIPGISAQVPDTFFGAGVLEDFPLDPFGHANCNFYPGQSGPDQPFQLLQAITNDVVAVQAAVNSMSLLGGYPIGCGGDTPEAHIESLYQIATGAGLASPGATMVPANNSGVGGVGFRETSMPIVVTITDAVSHENNPANACLPLGSYDDNAGTAAVTHNRPQMFDALDAICARVVPVAVSDFSPI
jgi:hypothetical protein